MKQRRKIVLLSVLLGICAIIHIYSLNSERVENGYSTHFFTWFSHILRWIFGLFPVSIGDFVYGILVIWLLVSLVKFIRRLLVKKQETPKKTIWKIALYRSIVFCCSIYIIFNIFWGINYDRKGIASQLSLELKPYTSGDLLQLNGLLVHKINDSKDSLSKQQQYYPSNKEMYSMVRSAYEKLSHTYPFLKYEPASLKTSMWGWLGNYTGFTGYYNPFTGEAQLNTTIPRFLLPFVACHEVGHQLGYAKEMEANFVGYLAASNTNNVLFHYSVYLDMFIYANRNLYMLDSTAAKKYRDSLSVPVINDLKKWAAFNRSHQSFIGPIVSWIYGKYLQGNRQPSGIMSYDEVTGFLIAYYKKFGRI